MNVLNDPEFNDVLKSYSPSLAEIPATELLLRWREETSVAEILHNFDVRPTSAMQHFEYDVEMNILETLDYFPNLWQIQVMGFDGAPPCSNQTITISAEDGLFHYAPFKKQGCPTWAEAQDRFIYGAWNVYRVDAGNPNFGTVSAIFRNSVVLNRTMIAPVDTGIYEMGCNSSVFPPGIHKSGMHIWPVVCNGPELYNWGWNESKPLASGSDFDHIMLPQAGFWNSTAGPAAGTQNRLHTNLARLFTRLMDERPYKSAINISFDETRSMYYEANIAAAALFKEGAVKAMVADFMRLFGTSFATRLVDWCIKYKVALFWSQGAVEPFSREEFYSIPANTRLVDPTVATGIGLNLSTSVLNSTLKLFSAQSKIATSSIPEPTKQNPFPSMPKAIGMSMWDLLWTSCPTEARSEPLKAKSCSAIDECVGVSDTGECFCLSK